MFRKVCNFKFFFFIQFVVVQIGAKVKVGTCSLVVRVTGIAWMSKVNQINFA